MSFRFVIGKVLAALATLLFVVCFNFFLFRVVESDPVANLYRGKNLTLEQRLKIRHEFGLDGSRGEQFVRYLQQTAKFNFGRSYSTNRPVRDGHLGTGVADDRARRRLDAPFCRLRRLDRDRRRMASPIEGRLRLDRLHDGDVLHARFLARDASPRDLRGHSRLVPGRRDHGLRLRCHGAREAARPGAPHVPACTDADARVPRRVRARDALVAPRHHARGLPDARPRQGPARRRGAQPPRCAERAAARGDADRDQLRLRALGRDRRRGDLLVAWARALVVRGAEGPRPRNAAGALSLLQRCGHLLQPSRRPPLRYCSTRGCALGEHDRGISSRDVVATPPARARAGVGAVPAPHGPG